MMPCPRSAPNRRIRGLPGQVVAERGGNVSGEGLHLHLAILGVTGGERHNRRDGVQVEVGLRQGEITVESAQFEAAFVPRKSTSNGWVVFTLDPSTVDEIEPRVLGYQQP